MWAILLVLIISLVSTQDNEMKNVKFPVDVYMESICGDCHRLIANELKFIALHPALLDYANITLHIFGKAHIISRNPPRFSCQFGERGCSGNKALNCIYKHSSSFSEAIQVMQCIFETGYSSDDSIKRCYTKFHLSSDEALRCFNGPESDQLLLEAGDATPELKWVPAFRDGDKIRLDTRNLVHYICDHINGVKPDVCLQEGHTVGMETDLYCVCFLIKIGSKCYH